MFPCYRLVSPSHVKGRAGTRRMWTPNVCPHGDIAVSREHPRSGELWGIPTCRLSRLCVSACWNALPKRQHLHAWSPGLYLQHAATAGQGTREVALSTGWGDVKSEAQGHPWSPSPLWSQSGRTSLKIRHLRLLRFGLHWWLLRKISTAAFIFFVSPAAFGTSQTTTADVLRSAPLCVVEEKHGGTNAAGFGLFRCPRVSVSLVRERVKRTAFLTDCFLKPAQVTFEEQ